jgi:hypothetical protein
MTKYVQKKIKALVFLLSLYGSNEITIFVIFKNKEITDFLPKNNDFLQQKKYPSVCRMSNKFGNHPETFAFQVRNILVQKEL